MEDPQNTQKKVKNVVFTKNGSIQTIPALSKRLKIVTDPVIGLQYVWEYRSPTKSVPPHYQCKLCKVQRLQNEMAAHITGWKHCFRYMKKSHSDKVPHDEEAATKDPAIRKAIRASAAEVEIAEGRGQIRVVIKEPGELPAFQSMKSAHPTATGGSGAAGLLGPAPRSLQPGGPFSGSFSDPTFPGEFLPRGGLVSDFPLSMKGGLTDGSMRRGQSEMGGLPSSGRYGNSMPGPDRLMGSSESMQRFPNSGPMRMGSDGFGMGTRSEAMGRPFFDDLTMKSGSDRIMGSGLQVQESSNTLATLLRHLDTFRIENEDDAQIVLKVTQKLTDILMEYRLRSISSVPRSTPSSSLGNMNYSSRLPPNGNDRFSGGNERFSGSNDRFSGSMTGSSRFYN
ncbi:hypothetical protein NFI96_014883 [Prochilodus magdalenae]|nr:hypothetical protein NFI96_014883 [Prochilodus magdalenae]